MTGNYEHSLDSAGRLIVPSKLREKLGPVFYVAPGSKENLTMYPLETWERLKARVSELGTADAEDMDAFFGFAQRCETDKQWRFQLSSDLKEYAGIDRDVVISGNNDRAQIWNKENWAAKRSKVTPSNIAEMMRRLKV